MGSLAYTTKSYVARAKKVHGKLYDYSKTFYTGALDLVVITCREHGEFERTATAHVQGWGCRECARIEGLSKYRMTDEQIIERVQKANPNLVEIKANRIFLDCPEHGSYSRKLHRYKYKHACPKCVSNSRRRKTDKTTEDFIRDARRVHGRRYDYSLVEYIRNSSNVKIRCKRHGVWLQTPNAHLSGRGCSRCNKHGYSKIAIEWMESLGYKGIQHALHGGEYRLPELRYKVDGYHAPTNTVFEFHGDAFHGNPKRFSPFSRPNPYSSKQAYVLNAETKMRERKIRQAGYNLISIWESDYRRGLNGQG